MTFLLLAINVIIFIFTYDDFMAAEAEMDAIVEDDAYLATQGAAFAFMIRNEPDLFSFTLRSLADQTVTGTREVRRTLGVLAMRNASFMTRAADYSFPGDQVALADWRRGFLRIEKLHGRHPSFRWGLSARHNEWSQWLTYQFSHGGVSHLFWNMLFLLVFGAFIEFELGWRWVLGGYLAGGVCGALGFSVLSGVTSSPLIGASGAISCLIGLVAFGWLKRQRLTFFYGILPAPGYFGFASLPSWLVILTFIVPDLSGYVAAHADIGSVAYGAHLGGVLAGAGLGGMSHLLKPPQKDGPLPSRPQVSTASGAVER